MSPEMFFPGLFHNETTNRYAPAVRKIILRSKLKCVIAIDFLC